MSRFEIFNADGLPVGKRKFTEIGHYIRIMLGNFRYAVIDNFTDPITNANALDEIFRCRVENRPILNFNRKFGADLTLWWTDAVDAEAANFARIIAMVEVVLLGYLSRFSAETVAVPTSSKVSIAFDSDGHGGRYLRRLEIPKSIDRCVNGLYYMNKSPAADLSAADSKSATKKINDRLVVYWSKKNSNANLIQM